MPIGWWDYGTVWVYGRSHRSICRISSTQVPVHGIRLLWMQHSVVSTSGSRMSNGMHEHQFVQFEFTALNFAWWIELNIHFFIRLRIVRNESVQNVNQNRMIAILMMANQQLLRCIRDCMWTKMPKLSKAPMTAYLLKRYVANELHWIQIPFQEAIAILIFFSFYVQRPDDALCISQKSFAIAISIAGLVLMLCVVAAVLCILARRRSKTVSNSGSSIYSGPYTNTAFSHSS